MHGEEIEAAGELGLDDPHMAVQCSINEREVIDRQTCGRQLKQSTTPPLQEAGHVRRATPQLRHEAPRRLRGDRRTIVSFVMLLVVWELLVRLLGVKLYILPPPSSVFVYALDQMATIGTAAWYTAQPMLIGYGFAVLIGVALALSFAISRLIEVDRLSADRVPADHSQDRDRPTVHDLVRLRSDTRKC